MIQAHQIWLIGGTQESAALAQAIAAHHLPCLITVTTESARRLYPPHPHLTVWVGRLAATTLPTFLQTHAIAAILDASHPFAVEISQLAIAIAGELHIPYLRYERPLVEKTAGESQELEVSSQESGARSQESGATVENNSHYSFPSLAALLATDVLSNQRVLLTVGYRSLGLFQPWQEKATLFARILPSVTALEAAIAAGFTSDRLVALRPPISALMEQALWQQWQISMVVTKASGVAGGEDVKRQVAAAIGIPLITIARPEMAYPKQTSDLAMAIDFCLHCLAV